MRVRPFFWGFFAFVCLGILVWAAIVPRQVPAQLSIHLMQQPSASMPTFLLVKVTDAQGIPINDAQIASQAWMTTMPMPPSRISTTPEGQGTYLVQLSLNMVGPWAIAVSMQANGFVPLHQMVAVEVSSAVARSLLHSETAQASTRSPASVCTEAIASHVTT